MEIARGLRFLPRFGLGRRRYLQTKAVWADTGLFFIQTTLVRGQVLIVRLFVTDLSLGPYDASLEARKLEAICNPAKLENQSGYFNFSSGPKAGHHRSEKQ